LSAESWKIVGLVVGGVGAIISALAKILDDREKSRVMLEAAEAAVSGAQKAHQPPRKRSLYISIAALWIAILGFVVGLLGEMSSLRSNGGPEVPLGSNSLIFGSQLSD